MFCRRKKCYFIFVNRFLGSAVVILNGGVFGLFCVANNLSDSNLEILIGHLSDTRFSGDFAELLVNGDFADKRAIGVYADVRLTGDYGISNFSLDYYRFMELRIDVMAILLAQGNTLYLMFSFGFRRIFFFLSAMFFLILFLLFIFAFSIAS